MKAVNGPAFWAAVLALAGLAVWLSLEPLQYLQMAMRSQHLEWRTAAGVAPLGLATLAVMFTAPTATRHAGNGRWRRAWTLLAVAYALAVGFAWPLRWLVWMLTADF